MKRLVLVLAVACVALLSGCATTSPTLASTADAASQAHRPQVNAVYVAQVEQIAAKRGVKVIWVNPPLRR